MLKRLVILWLAMIVVAACEPEATPLPVDIVPTATPTSAVPPDQPIRYGMDPNVLLVMASDAYAAIEADGQIEQVAPPFLETDLGSRYDVLIALGDLPNGTPVPTPITLSLAINTTLPPLNDTALVEIVQDALNPQALLPELAISGAEALPHTGESPQALRTALANLGVPDGFDLRLATFAAPGAQIVAPQLAAVGIETHITELAGDTTPAFADYHLVLFTGNRGRPSFGGETGSIIDLVTIPVSYRAIPDLTIEFTADGWLLARR